MKLRSICARTALVLQELRHVCEQATSEAIDEYTVAGAARCIDHYKATARRVHARLQSSPEDLRLERVRHWIMKRNGGRTTPRDLVRSGVAGIKKTQEARKLLNDLYDRGHGVFEDGTYILGVCPQ